MSEPANPWGAQIADTSPEGTKVCVPPWSESTPPMGMTEVCDPYEGTWPEVPAVPDASSFEDTGSDADVEVDAGDDVAGDGGDDATDDIASDVDNDVREDADDDAADDVGEDAQLDVTDDGEDAATDGQEGG